jgi:hypothetical protein
MTQLGELDLEEAAKEAAGNWQRFQCFVWWKEREIEDSKNWAIIYTHHRDSGLLDQSNAEVIRKAMLPFADTEDPDVVFESHSHWAVGSIEGFSIRVFRDGEITEAFTKYHELAERMANYPILDETDCSNREYEATVQNIDSAAWKLKHDFELPEGREAEAYSWLSEHCYSAIENCDDQGGYPSEEELTEAFAALGYEQLETA